MPQAGFESVIPENELLKTHALARAATGIEKPEQCLEIGHTHSSSQVISHYACKSYVRTEGKTLKH
jgi:hypothetical protein